ncbi:MAG: RNA-directed DNA polymerase [Pirellulales bacterium]|nr:RNA-directed DNA polymerase [Pirellulales bacterium]
MNMLSQHTMQQNDWPPPISTRERLARTLNVSPVVIGEFVAEPARWYSQFTVPKPSGGNRIIQPPKKPLRRVQRALLRLLYSRLQVPPYLHGGVPKRSILTHARSHLGRKMVATLDVKNFFPSTQQKFVQPIFEMAGIVDEALTDALAITMLAEGLPQGAPTSSLLANLAFVPVDKAVIALCRSRNLSFSRYVDDIALSGNVDFRELKGPLIDRIHAAEYEIAEHKVRFMPASERQVVTGLVVNQKLRPTAEFVATLKSDIRVCLGHGVDFLADSEGISTRGMRMRLSGRAAHIAAADPKLGKRIRGMLCGVKWTTASR